MKEIKAYVRSTMAQHVTAALDAIDELDFSILEVRGVSRRLPRDLQGYSVALGEIVEQVTKFEIVCRDENVDRIVTAIQKAAKTGHKGDGMIFVSPVDDAIRVASGARGDGALPV